jgi:hypothetical protein
VSHLWTEARDLYEVTGHPDCRHICTTPTECGIQYQAHEVCMETFDRVSTRPDGRGTTPFTRTYVELFRGCPRDIRSHAVTLTPVQFPLDIALRIDPSSFWMADTSFVAWDPRFAGWGRGAGWVGRPSCYRVGGYHCRSKRFGRAACLTGCIALGCARLPK